MRLELQFDGPEDELIEIAEILNDEPLDSRDLGDAMGVFIAHAMFNDSEFEFRSNQGHTLTAAIIFDSFSWEGVD